jgi:hypothetical protein
MGTYDRPLALSLLRYAAAAFAQGGMPAGLQAVPAGTDELEWTLAAGLGPMLYCALDPVRADALPAAWRDRMRAADLSARTRHANLVAAAAELIDLCSTLGSVPLLLKGISLSEQHYPLGHLRPMTDIDILLPRQAHARLELLLLEHGYVPMPDFGVDERSCHGVPLLLPDRAAWVEVHWALFPPSSALRSNRLFSEEQLDAQTVSWVFRGRSVRRLSDEMQLIYLASGWTRDISSQDLHASFLPALFDALALLHAPNTRIDWDMLLGEVDNQAAAASLAILLAYVDRHGLYRLPPAVLPQLLGKQRLIGRVELAILHRLLDTHLLSHRRRVRAFESWHLVANLMARGPTVMKLVALPWKVLFPPGMPDRYRLTGQVERAVRRVRHLVAAARSRPAHQEVGGGER